MSLDARLSVLLPSHPKTKKLIRRLGKAGAWDLVRLFLWVASNRSDGDLSGLSDEDLELSIDFDGEEGSFISALVEVGFIDGDAGARKVHDWQEHNPWAAGADARSEKSRWAAVCKQHGRQEAARLMPEYAKRIGAAPADDANGKQRESQDSANELPKSATGTPLAGSGCAPSPSPSPSPEEEAKASLSTSSPEKPMDELFADEGKAKAAGVPSCPIDALLDAYEELLPTLPAPRRSLFKAGKRAAPMRQRWAWVLTATHERGPRAGQRLATNAAEGVEWFRKYFEHVAKSDFLTGRDGKWTGCNIGFLMQLEKFSKVLEGAYHQAEVPHA